MKKKFYILMSIYLILILLDGLLTYLNTPDLAKEGNPLVSYFGLGWGALFTANLIVFILLVVLTHYSFVRYKTIKADTRNCREYISMIFFDRPDKFAWFFYKFPKHWAPAIACMGYGFIYSLIVARIILVCEWAFNLPAWYYAICGVIPGGRLDIAAALIVLGGLVWLWFHKEYKKSKGLIM